MGNKVSGFINSLYDSKRKQLLGRDGAAWGKLGVFYFFFYLGLAGFFCAMLAVFMALSPRDHPRYYDKSSRMATRSNPLSPGLGFRPQPEIDKNLIMVAKSSSNKTNIYSTSLDQYLDIYYWKDNPAKDTDSTYDSRVSGQMKPNKFIIRNPGECTSRNSYGYNVGRPCVLVKMNKIVGFKPLPGSKPEEKAEYDANCGTDANPNGVSIYCHGEYYADADNLGPVMYMSEHRTTYKCGSLDKKWFPYKGKVNRKDVYQAPYIWVQFANPKPNVLINVLCRVYGENIDFDKKTARALTRFQIYVDDPKEKKLSKRSEF